jgi:hypothetical protein
MRKLALLTVAAAMALTAQTPPKPPVHVDEYTRKDGTTVAPHDRTAPDHTKQNNWSEKGNVNPETGKKGDKK